MTTTFAVQTAKPPFQLGGPCAILFITAMAAPQNPQEEAQDLLEQASSLETSGDPNGAIGIYEQIVDRFGEASKNPVLDRVAISLNHLAVLTYGRGDAEYARSLLERALAINEREPGSESPDTATTLTNLANLLRSQRELDSARPLYERALTIRETVLGPEHPDTASSLNNLAGLLQEQGELAAARAFYERALQIRERVLGLDHPATASSLNNLADLLTAQGELTAARPLYERALDIQRRVLGPEHPNTAATYDGLGSLLQAIGDLQAARAAFERALDIREKVLPSDDRNTAVSLRHLATVLQAMGETEAAQQYLKRAEATLNGSREDGATDDSAGHVRSVPPPTSFLPRYRSDSAEGIDLLGITSEVEALAKVLAARKTEPPLSVGLFADWGAGKSFFMRKLRNEIDRLAAASEGVPDSSFCTDVVQIDFNAWHYVEADLWASLVTNIFDELHQNLAARAGRDPGALLKRLLTYEEEERKLSAAKKELTEAERKVRALTLGWVADKQSQSKDDVRSIEQALGRPSQEVAVEDVLELTDADLGSAARIVRIFRQLRGSRRILALSALACLVAVPVIAVGIGKPLLLSIDVPAGIALFLAGQSLIGHVLDAAEKLAKNVLVKQELEDRRRARDIAQRNRDRARTVYERAKKLEEGTVYSFIEERYASSDYRTRLGIIALVQRDFHRLSEALTKSEDDQSRSESRAVSASLAETESNDGQNTESDTELPKVDRIVLYIDDLDRCPASLVVKVLQAVHLLLAFKLFVVVVGVDARWLLHSLEAVYDLRLESGSEAGVERASDWASTPRNYLEKIFQIPYWLRPMDAKIGYARLVRDLLKDEVAKAVSDTDQRAAEVAAAGRSPSAQEAVGSAQEVDVEDGAVSAEYLSPIELRPKGLELTRGEVDFLERLGPLVPTPRAAKRLLNIYRLLRVSLPPHELSALIGEDSTAAEYPSALLLLGIVTGFPELASVVFPVVAKAEGDNWWALVDALATHVPNNNSRRAESSLEGSWQDLMERLTTFRNDVRLTALQPFKKWAPRAARFSFQAGRQTLARERANYASPPNVESVDSEHPPSVARPTNRSRGARTKGSRTNPSS